MKGVSCPTRVKSLILISRGGLCGRLAPFGHRAKKKSKEALQDANKAGDGALQQNWGQILSSFNASACSWQGTRGDVCSFKARRMWGTRTAVGFWRVLSGGEKCNAQLHEVWTALRCCVLVSFHGLWRASGLRGGGGEERPC